MKLQSTLFWPRTKLKLEHVFDVAPVGYGGGVGGGGLGLGGSGGLGG
jgi:hypothetical protein